LTMTVRSGGIARATRSRVWRSIDREPRSGTYCFGRSSPHTHRVRGRRRTPSPPARTMAHRRPGDGPIDRARPYSLETLSCSVTEPPRSVCALIRLLRPPALDLLASGRTPDPGLATNVASVAGYSGAHNPVTGESPHPDVGVPPPAGGGQVSRSR